MLVQITCRLLAGRAAQCSITALTKGSSAGSALEGRPADTAAASSQREGIIAFDSETLEVAIAAKVASRVEGQEEVAAAAATVDEKGAALGASSFSARVASANLAAASPLINFVPATEAA